MNFKKIKIDKTLLVLVLILSIISLLSIHSASTYLSKTLGNLALKQFLWYLVGIIIIFFIFKFKLTFIMKISPYLYLLNVLLLLGLLFIAPEINGSKCWYVLDGVGSFQPSEFMKITILLFEVYIVNKFNKKYNSPTIFQEFRLLLLIGVIFLIPAILTFLEPDTGAIIVYFIITISILFISNIRARWFIIAGIVGCILIIMFFYLYFYKQDTFIKVLGSDFFYRIDRVINWKSGSGMQLENSLAAIGSSGIIGHGFNKTPLYFPESGTDFIFTVFASNFGLLGSTILISIITFLDLHIINIGKNSKSTINRLIISGIIGILLYQQIQNISMTIGLMPITGITLPFISYGGSSLIAYMTLIGLVFYIYSDEKYKT